MKIRVLGAHNTESQQTRCAGLVVDGKIALDAGSITSSLTLTEQWNLKVLLLSHQHYDHTRDVPALSMNLYLSDEQVHVYTTRPVYKTLMSHQFDGEMYPDFTSRPEGKPVLTFTVIDPLEPFNVEGYTITAVPVKHSVPTVGYQVVSPKGGTLFYGADTGPDLKSCWENVKPQVIIIETTAANRFSEFGKANGHLTPELLRDELVVFRDIHGYIPQVVSVHMSPGLEDEIRKELAEAAAELECTITPGYEGMEIDL